MALAGATTPTIEPVRADVPDKGSWYSWLLDIARTLNLVLKGKINATTTVTLAPSATQTTLQDTRIGPLSTVQLEAQTASAATARLTAPGIYVVPGMGSVVIHHPSNAAADQTFGVTIFG